MKQLSWEQLKELLGSRLKMSSEVLDFVAVRDILQLCAAGSSYYTISNFTDLDIDYIKTVLKESIDFEGWNSDLDFNPAMIYQTCSGDYEDFIHEISTLNPSCKKQEIAQAYLVAHRYITLNEEMEKLWI